MYPASSIFPAKTPMNSVRKSCKLPIQDMFEWEVEGKREV
jgi:hypothetical protein